jgi:hypothetical protein
MHAEGGAVSEREREWWLHLVLAKCKKMLPSSKKQDAVRVHCGGPYGSISVIQESALEPLVSFGPGTLFM